MALVSLNNNNVHFLDLNNKFHLKISIKSDFSYKEINNSKKMKISSNDSSSNELKVPLNSELIMTGPAVVSQNIFTSSYHTSQDSIPSSPGIISITSSTSNKINYPLRLNTPLSPRQPSLYSQYAQNFSKSSSTMTGSRPPSIILSKTDGTHTYISNSFTENVLFEEDSKYFLFSKKIIGDVQYITDFLDQWKYMSKYLPFKILNIILRSVGAPINVNNPISGVFFSAAIVLESYTLALWGFASLLLALSFSFIGFEQQQLVASGRVAHNGFLLGLYVAQCFSYKNEEVIHIILAVVILVIIR